MRDYDDYPPGVLANEKRNRENSEIAARDEFNRQHPPTTGLVVPEDLRKMELPASARARSLMSTGCPTLSSAVAPSGFASTRKTSLSRLSFE